MNPSIKLDLWLALAVGCSILTLLLWIDRHSFWIGRRRLLESKEPRGHWKSTVLLYILIVACSVGAALGWHHVYFGGGYPLTPLPGSASQQYSATVSNDVAMVMAALGVFVALIIGITVTTNRHSVEDIRRAGEEQAERHREYLAGLNNRYSDIEISYRNMKVSSLLEQTRINVISDMARADYLMGELQIDPTSLLVAKLEFLNEARRFRDEGFSVNKLVDLLGALEDMMKNEFYQNRLKLFFSRDDIDICKALYEFFHLPTTAAPRPGYQQAVEALEGFISQLERIIGVT